VSHSVLARQLAKAGLDRARPPTSDEWAVFLTVVERTYRHADQERKLSERAVWLSSAEMAELHASLATERDKLKGIIGALGEGVMVYDRALRVESLNQVGESIFGAAVDELVGREIGSDGNDGSSSGWEALAEPCRRALEGEHVRVESIRVRLAGARDVYLSLSCSPLQDGGAIRGGVATLRDITERRRLEEELQQAQRLEAVGRLAAGIAHEINTPIQFIGDNVAFLQGAYTDRSRVLEAWRAVADAADPAAAMERARQIEAEADIEFLAAEVPAAISQTLDGIDRVATIVRAMKTFGHPSGEEKVEADLNEAVRTTLVVANNQLKYVAKVLTELGDLPPVWCHPGDLNQVILNLLVNAAHAVADAGRTDCGEVVVRTRSDGSSVVISVSDNGTGIAAEDQDRVFEPFFTTKEVGRGTGQGLALTHSIVTQRHGGSLWFETTPGESTTFFVKLPVRQD
jgi:PAS domain S-box-containing protein